MVEYNSAIYAEDGLDVDDVKNYMLMHGSLENYPHADEATSMDPAEFMEKPCDVLVPAAKEKAINMDNCD